METNMSLEDIILKWTEIFIADYEFIQTLIK